MIDARIVFYGQRDFWYVPFPGFIVSQIRHQGEDIVDRLTEWEQFSNQVADHVINYTIPQYGNAPDDHVGAWTARDCVNAMARYIARYGSGARGDTEQRRDFLKLAHYACLALSRWEEGKR